MTDPRRQLRRACHVGVVACVVLACSTLPRAMFPWPWLAAMAVPAMLVFAVVQRLPIRPWERGLVAAILQVGAIVLCLQAVGPLHRLAALGCTLLPPLAFLALRCDVLDAARAVFLSFCVLLIGAILGDPPLWSVLAFVVAAVSTLHVDVAAASTEDRASWRGRAPGPVRRAAVGSTLALATLAVFLIVLQGLRSLPSPRDAKSTPRSAAATVGLSSDFAFDAGAGSLLAIRASRIIDVASGDGRAVPSDLYLRCGAFDVAGLDRWDTRPYRAGRIEFRPERYVQIGPHDRGSIERQLQIRIVEPGTGFAYVAPGTYAIHGAEPMLGSKDTAVFRFADVPAVDTAYSIRYQNRRAEEIDDVPDGRLAGLTELGGDLRPWFRMFDAILAEPRVRREVDPIGIAHAIARVLAERCRYALHEPTGPHDHSLLNFLEGSHEGFCMHFASATAICLRRAGVPARIGVGLYGGDDLPDEWGVRTFGSQHAHAWVEIPFADHGWVVFDPTPAAGREGRRWIDPEDDAPAASGTGGADGDPVQVEGNIARLVAESWPWAIALVVLLVVTQVRFDRRGAATDTARPVTGDARSARKTLERVLRDLARRGLVRMPQETLEAFGARLDADGVDTTVLRDAFAAYQEVRFGQRRFDTERRARLERALTD